MFVKNKLFKIFIILIIIIYPKIILADDVIDMELVKKIETISGVSWGRYYNYQSLIVTDKYFVIGASQANAYCDTKQSAAIFIDRKDLTFVKQVDGYFCHMNDMAYDYDKDLLYIPRGKTMYIIDTKTFELTTRTVPRSYAGLAYADNIYYGRTNGRIYTLDANFKDLEYFEITDEHATYLAHYTQGIAYINGKIIYSLWKYQGKSDVAGTYQNFWRIFDAKTGTLEKTQLLNRKRTTAEMEATEFDRYGNPYMMTYNGHIWKLIVNPVSDTVKIKLTSNTINYSNERVRAILTKPDGTRQTISNNRDEFILDNNYTEAGIYNYNISLINDNNDILYDQDTIKLTVTVSYDPLTNSFFVVDRKYKNNKTTFKNELGAFIISNNKFKIDNNNMIFYRIGRDTTVNNFISSLDTSSDYSLSIYDENNNAVSNTNRLKTGYKVSFVGRNNSVNYTCSVIGDVNGDGYVNKNDAKIVSRHIIKSTLITNKTYNYSADYDLNGKIAINDVTHILRGR